MKKIAVLFGGRSAEHEISIMSAIQAMDALDVTRYEIIPVYIAQSGRWYTGQQLRKIDFYKRLAGALSELQEVTILPKPEGSCLQIVSEEAGLSRIFARQPKQIAVDVFLPVFHGQFGEDGCIQGLFEMAEVAYAGSPVLASAVAMNKYHCKMFLSAHGIPVLPGVLIQRERDQFDLMAACERVLATKGFDLYPLFVKPVNLGSSVGVSRAENRAELAAAIAKVFQVDAEALIEPCVQKLMEINVSVIEGEVRPEVSVVEIPVASGGFLSYEDKYLREGKGKKGPSSQAQGMAGLTRVIDPQDLDPAYRDRVRRYAAEAYTALGCSGIVRFDFMVDLSKGELYFNELNPIPGSLSFYLWEKSHPPRLFSDILDRVIEGAERRYRSKKELKRDLGFKALRG
jgi:D-alanine-D-alanine ligase